MVENAYGALNISIIDSACDSEPSGVGDGGAVGPSSSVVVESNWSSGIDDVDLLDADERDDEHPDDRVVGVLVASSSS